MSAIVTPTAKSSAKPFLIIAAVSVAALVVVITLAIAGWATRDGGGRATPTRGNVISTEQPVQSLNALSSELPASAIAHWARAEGLTGLSPASLHQPVNVSPVSPSPQSVNALSPVLQSVNVSATAGSVTASECRLTGPC
jgi:hypothetical protein